MANGLTPKQQRFIQEYLVDCNAAQAAIRSGYAEAAAKEIGYENLTKPHIAEAIAQAQQQRSADCGVTAAWALRRVKIEAEFEGEGSSHSARVAALNLAMKHLGMLTERVEATVTTRPGRIKVACDDDGPAADAAIPGTGRDGHAALEPPQRPEEGSGKP